MEAPSFLLFRAKALLFDEPQQIVKMLNEDLCKENENMMFVTLFLGMVDLKSNTMKYCNAGHNYPYLISEDGLLTKIEDTHGAPLGVYPGSDYGVSEIAIPNNSKLVIFTDGVVEAMDKNDQLYGENRLETLISVKRSNDSPEDNVLKILNDVYEFATDTDQSDDITIMQINFGKA